MDADFRTTVAGFAGAGMVLVILFWLIGIDGIVATISRAEPSILLGVVAFSACWMVCWGLVLHTVLGAIGSPVGALTAVLAFSASMFTNAITPFGQAGGEPVAAMLISEAADSDYETGLAAIASVDTLHFLPSIGLATVGLGTLFVESVSLTRNIYLASVAVALLSGAFLGGALLGWFYRAEIERFVVRVFTPTLRRLAGALPRLEPPEKSAVEESIEGFFAAIDRVARSRRTVLLASLYSLAGWLSLSGALWLSLMAIGYSVPFVAALIVVPVGSIAAVTPLPGGLGGIEAAFIGLVVSTTGVAASVAGAAVVIYRIATYWLPLIVGGSTAAVLGSRRRRPD
ncbi:lysylphosphatidylglycerol synthase transmembrane domain-containing protein [Halorhabdus rudnickae]|uniref:lysylphosphatidylglycerol synthase transmembrane domain-containing protein n=1 Tax=Halorhabdus rudnickae TaxID=1775544 RepID=UPI0010831BA9|nr:lysylphosphatidylglycerol synthase transmembrane domain-containing protein [Halorhabdus rudnickae]